MSATWALGYDHCGVGLQFECPESLCRLDVNDLFGDDASFELTEQSELNLNSPAALLVL